MDRFLDTQRWLVAGPRRPGGPRLYCFPHGGGSAAEYVRWGRELPTVEVHAVQLPGRGTRLGEPPLTDMATLVTALVDRLPFGRRDGYALFGHSLGSLVAYEVACELRRRGGPLPGHLVLSGFRAPSRPSLVEPVHHLGDDDLIAEVDRRHGGFPPEVAGDPALRRMLAGYLRADYQILETYEYVDSEPLPVPITVLGGRSDGVTGADLAAWQRHTTEPVTVRLFPGGHFYLREHGPEVRRAVAGAILGTQRKAA
jgi:surfactin synthase thioesterase subunit